ncbi:elastase-1-like [Physella acuta]|uniref:elastase-1-like n=1 Tax=Physella acuta TaxID=109671 RepID=UPI0027DCC53E|nr:elastase-1-like [Physella acuta]XP_059174379.1 elastase-1-like [Physella acuta]
MKELLLLVLLCADYTWVTSQAELCSVSPSIRFPLDLLKKHYEYNYPRIPLEKNLPMLNQGECGVSKNDQSKQIINGKDAPANAWPWQVWVVGAAGMCGGSIIHRQWIVTAGHCFEGENVVKVYHGNNIKRNGNITMTDRQILVERNDDATAIDMALFRLTSPLSFSDSVQPICLPEGNVWDASPCFLTGWGMMSGGGYPDILQQIRVKILNQSVCKAFQGVIGGIEQVNNYFCTEAVDTPNGEYRGASYGDSGGPVSCLKNGRYYLVGVKAFAIDLDGTFMNFESTVSRNVDIINGLIRKYS